MCNNNCIVWEGLMIVGNVKESWLSGGAGDFLLFTVYESPYQWIHWQNPRTKTEMYGVTGNFTTSSSQYIHSR